MKKLNVRSVLSILIVTATTVALIWYIKTHPQYIDKIFQTNLLSVILLLAINLALVFVLAGIYQFTVQIAGKKLGTKENFLLTIYSSIANFFGPLQSGPGVRAVYLKKKHSIRLRDYTFATLVYYAVFAVINAFFMLVGTRPWWQTFLAVIGATGLSYVFIRWFKKRNPITDKNNFSLSATILMGLFLFTLLQVMLMTARYYVDLHATQTNVSIGQAVSYTGSANMALFVSITPDGIGIRETFLLFTQKLHGVSTQSIISASLLDRASYILFLTLLFLFALATHARDRLKLRQ